MRSAFVIATVVLLAVGTRLPGLFTDFWVDEVWSLSDVLALKSWTDIFLTLRIDNNHHLNSAWLYLLGSGQHAALYRLPAFVAGLGSVVIAWRIGARDGRLNGGLTALVFAWSFPLAYYSSEARGYASAVCLTLLALWWLQRYCDTQRSSDAAGFWATSVLAMMGHASFVFAFIGMLLWTDSHAERISGSVRKGMHLTLRAFVVPGIAILVFYLVCLRGMAIGGGPPYSLPEVATQTLSLMVGGPLGAPTVWIAAAASAAAFVAAVSWLKARQDDRWLLYVASCVVVPGLFIVLTQPRVLMPRYLLIPVALALLPISQWLAFLLSRQGVWRALAIGLLALYGTGNTVHLAKFASTGRGQYRDALTDILGATPHEPVTVRSAGHKPGEQFRTRLVVNHYADVLGRGRTRLYETTEPAAADFIIREGRGDGEPYRDGWGNMYVRWRYYPSSELAGIDWTLYRRQETLNWNPRHAPPERPHSLAARFDNSERFTRLFANLVR